jgi:hypothetical protein
VKQYRILEESNSHFKIAHPNGVSFYVAKARLDPSTTQLIKRYADGGPVEADVGQSAFSSAKLGIEPTMPASPATPPEYYDWPSSPAPRPKAAEAEPPQQAQESPPISQTPAPTPAETPKSPSGYGAGKTYAGYQYPGEKEAMEGIKLGAQAAERNAMAAQAAQNMYAIKSQEISNRFQTNMAAHQAHSQKIADEVEKGDVDPNRWWGSRTTGSKMLACIGMVLGGLASKGGENAAYKIIQDQIDRDLKLQQDQLGRKQNLLSRYLEMGHSMEDSYKLARADATDLLAAQMQSIAAKSSSDQVQANASTEAGKLKMLAAQYRQQAETHSMQMQHSSLELQMQRMGMELQRAQIGVMQRAASGQAIPESAMSLLPKEQRELYARTPSGSLVQTRSKEDTKTVSEGYAFLSQFKNKIQDYYKLYKEHPHGTMPLTADKARAEALQADILSEMSHLHDLNRLSDEDVKIFKSQIPDLTSFKFNSSENLAKLQQLGRAVDDKLKALNNTYLNAPFITGKG